MNGVFLDTETMGDGLDFTPLTDTLPRWQYFDRTEPDAVVARIADAAVVVTNKVVLGAEQMDAAPRLKLICVSATGTNNIDLKAAAERGITVCNVSGYAGASVAQHTFALMLILATQIEGYAADVRDGYWSASPLFCLMQRPVVELAGKTLLIIGKGALGEAVANIARAFEMQVVFAASLRESATDTARPHYLDVLPKADFVSLHCPLAPETAQLVDQTFLNAMKPSAFLINTARGGLIDEAALANALRDGHIAGAGLDGLSVEPPPQDHLLLKKDIPNLIITPHNAWVSVECRQRLLDGVVANIQQWQNRKPINVVTA